MSKLNSEIKKVVSQLKDAQAKLQSTLKSNNWVEEVKSYAESQRKEVSKLIHTDVKKVKAFLEKERKQLESVQKMIPGEVEKFKVFFHKQKREFEKMLRLVKRASKKDAQAKSSSAKKSTSKK